MKTTTNLNLLAAARDAWMAGASLRCRRQRHKRYTYGDQWGDYVRDDKGRYVLESDLIAETGRKPLTNNMIRQIVKTVIGRFRSTARQTRAYCADSPARKYIADNSLLELDCRMLEEFLISGCAIQRISRESRRGCSKVWIDNVDPRKFFVNSFHDPRGHDIEMAGMLHDLSFPEVVSRFAGDCRASAERLAHIYNVSSADSPARHDALLGEASDGDADFFIADAGRCRVIEVWTLDCRNTLLCHDPLDARAYCMADSASARGKIAGLNAARLQAGQPEVDSRRRLDFVWRCRWFAPDGSLLASYDTPYAHRSHPFAIKFYPLTDGEVHSFVEDVIDQQRCVNRMVVLIDHIIASSAKGVLLFPQDQKPANYDWSDISDTWSRTNGVIPITGRGGVMPQQVSTPAGQCGAYELLSLQMKLFDRISGVSDVLAGRNISPSVGNALYESQLQNSAIALADVIETFEAFCSERNDKATNL